MVVSLNTSFSPVLREKAGEEKLIAMIAEAGFEATELSFDHIGTPGCPWDREDFFAYAQHLKRIAAGHGIRFNQASAPTQFDWDKQDCDALNYYVYPSMERVFAACEMLEIPCAVIEPLWHPSVIGLPSRKFTWNVTYFGKLAQMAAQYGVKASVKNIIRSFEKADELNDLLDAVGNENLFVCLDIGHSNISGDKPEVMIRKLGATRLRALHVHGNQGDHDEHMAPGIDYMNWQTILEALAEICYDGDFTLHLSDGASSYLKADGCFDADFVPHVLQFACDSGKYLSRSLAHMMEDSSGIDSQC